MHQVKGTLLGISTCQARVGVPEFYEIPQISADRICLSGKGSYWLEMMGKYDRQNLFRPNGATMPSGLNDHSCARTCVQTRFRPDSLKLADRVPVASASEHDA